ncbi:MAG: type II secretion system protein N [Sphingosinicella sp.]
MALGASMRVSRLSGRLPRLTWFQAVELALLALIAIQAARLFWILVTPVGPVGDYRIATAPQPTGAAPLGEFDPFFRLAGPGGGAVTALNLKLYGVREDRATGLGSAIIALPDGSQRSFAVGEEIMPGVTLSAVGFDHVTINRGGATEQIFIDQSTPPAAGQAANPTPPAAGQAATPAPPPAAAPAQPPRASPAPTPATPPAPRNQAPRT